MLPVLCVFSAVGLSAEDGQVGFSGKWYLQRDLDTIFERFPTGSKARPRNRYQLNIIRDLYRQMLAEKSADAPGGSTLIRSALGRLIVLLMRGCTEARHAVADRGADLEAVLHYLDDNFASPVQLKDLARLCGV
jgi:hypothetical protein